MSLVVVTGARGLLGGELVAAFLSVGDHVVGLTRDQIDLERPASLAQIGEIGPDVVVNAAAWTDVDGCALHPERAMRINGKGAGLVAGAAARAGAAVIHISTNEVFDGNAARAYTEDDPANPINPYGASKLAGEQAVASATERHLIIRTAWLFGAGGGFPHRIRAAASRAMAAGRPLRVVEDEWGNPTPVAPLATGIAQAARLIGMRDNPRILHLAGEPPVTRLDWARQVLVDVPVPLQPIRRVQYSRPSLVPPHAVLATDRARALGVPVMDWRASMGKEPR